MFKLHFYTKFVTTPHVSVYLDHLQGVTLHQQSIHKNMDGLLNTLKFVLKMSADIKFTCSSVGYQNTYLTSS